MPCWLFGVEEGGNNAYRERLASYQSRLCPDTCKHCPRRRWHSAIAAVGHGIARDRNYLRGADRDGIWWYPAAWSAYECRLARSGCGDDVLAHGNDAFTPRTGEMAPQTQYLRVSSQCENGLELRGLKTSDTRLSTPAEPTVADPIIWKTDRHKFCYSFRLPKSKDYPWQRASTKLFWSAM